MQANPVVIVSAQRTPLGNFQGCLQSFSATDLGAAAIRSAMLAAKVEPDAIEGLIMGCVLPAGLGQAPARQAARAAGLPDQVSCTTINKVCGSGMQALMYACDGLRAGSTSAMIAGGMESMTNAPYLLPKARSGYRLGHQRTLDHLFFDGLENADDHQLMGHFAEQCAQKYGFTREEQDSFALHSVQKARQASAAGLFNDEITPIAFKGEDILLDEGPVTARPEKIPLLKPAFSPDGTITAANASSISDGAAALVLMTQQRAEQLQLTPLARIVGYSSYAQEPAWFTTSPAGAIKNLLKTIGWSIDDVDLFEINEAFAVVTLAAQRELQLDPTRVNVHGGACVLGHPLGASGARIVVTLLHALLARRVKKGIATLCIGGGEATAIALELIV